MTKEEFDVELSKRDYEWGNLAQEAWQAWTDDERAKATIDDLEADVEDTLLSIEENRLRDVPKDKYMIAVLDSSYYEEHGDYPEEFHSDFSYTGYFFDTPEEFVAKWFELPDGDWYWCFDKGEIICSGAIDPGDIEIFEDHFDMSFEDNSPTLPESITITAATLAVDTDAIYEDEAWLSEIISEYLSDTYGYCQSGFSLEVIYNEFNEPSETIVSNIEWDIDKPLEETSEAAFEKHILKRLSEKGFDVSQIELDVLQFIDAEHQNCIWYGGPVATVEYKGHVFWLEAHGDVSVTWYPQEGFDDDEYDYSNKNNTGAYSDYDARDHFVDDTHFSALNKEGRLAWQNNNWFEVFVETPDGVKHDLMDVCSSDYLGECIGEMVEGMDHTLESLYRDKNKVSSVDKLIANASVECENQDIDAVILSDRDLDMSSYMDKGFDKQQLAQIKAALQVGILSADKIAVFAKPEFSAPQMAQLRYGLESGLDMEPYAKPEINWEALAEIRKELLEEEKYGFVLSDSLEKRIYDAKTIAGQQTGSNCVDKSFTNYEYDK